MNEPFFLGLIHNASLLLAMVLLFEFMTSRLKKNNTCLWKIFVGLLSSAVGIGVMSTNWTLLSGVVFDTRSVLLGVTGLFFGGVPVLIAIVATSIFRFYQGGVGVLMGIPVIVSSGLIGLLWRYFRLNSLHKLGWFELLCFGVLIHLAMLLCTFMLPSGVREITLSSIWLPVMTIYPVATLLMGVMLSNRLLRDKSLGILSESEEKYRFLVETMSQGVTIQDKEGRVLETNNAACQILGLSCDQMKGKTPHDSRWEMTYEDGSEMNPDNTPSNVALKTGKPVIRKIFGIYVPEIKERKWILVSSVPRFRPGENEPYLTLTTFSDITEIKKAEYELIESEEKFHSLFSSMVEGVAIHEIVYDEDGVPQDYIILDVNSAYKKQTGITGDVTGKLGTEVYKTEKPPYLEKFLVSVDDKKSYTFETFFGPLKKTFRITVCWMGNSRFATIFEDVTEKNLFMQKLKESEEKFSKIFTYGPQIITISSLNKGVFLDVNEAFVQELGYAKTDVIGKSALEMNIWEKPELRKKILGDLKRKRILKNIELNFRKKNGNVIPCLGSMTTITIGGEKYLVILGVNIEKRVKAINDLSRLNFDILNEKQKLESILRDMGDAVFVTDAEKRITLANRAMETLCGLKEREIKGKKIEEVIDLAYESTHEKATDLIRSVFSSKKVVIPKETLVLTRKDGLSVLVDGVTTPLLDTGGNLIGTVWVQRDVTKEREINKMKSDFVSLASHQLRTPLTGIKWFVELLEENASKIPIDKVREYVRKIGESNNRMIGLVNDLMTTSKADSGKMNEEISDQNVKTLLQQSIDEQGRLFLDKNIKIVGVDEIPDELSFEVDMLQMIQVFGNLFNNAASYSKSGSTINVKCKEIGDIIQISIEDSGVGIPTDQQGKVFQKFFRADNVSKTIPGSGLGLYLAKSMVEVHGGKIWFVSKENIGTTFFVELPIKQKNG